MSDASSLARIPICDCLVFLRGGGAAESSAVGQDARQASAPLMGFLAAGSMSLPIILYHDRGGAGQRLYPDVDGPWFSSPPNQFVMLRVDACR